MNPFTADEIVDILEALGSTRVEQRSRSIRGTCCVHGGDNPSALAAWIDNSGEWRLTCHTHGCFKGASIEWVARRVLQGSIEDAVYWIGKRLGRSNLIVTSFNRSKELAIQEDAHPPVVFSGDESEIARLRQIHPYHAYWQGRGYTKSMVDLFELTYRSLDHKAIIPIRDAERRLLGTMERAMDGTEPKYRWNSPNPNKGSFLFGIPQALSKPRTIRLKNGEQRRMVFLVEGTLDGVKASDLGFPVVASMTNRLTAAQAETLIHGWDLVLVIPDGDIAGANLESDVIKRCSPFQDIAIYHLPEQFKDLDSLPTEDIPGHLNHALEAWETQYTAANRRRRQQPLVLS